MLKHPYNYKHTYNALRLWSNFKDDNGPLNKCFLYLNHPSDITIELTFKTQHTHSVIFMFLNVSPTFPQRNLVMWKFEDMD